MRRAIRRIGVALVVLVVAFVAFVATRPAEFRVARARTVAAPPAVVHAYVEDFRRWPAWSPWERMDPAMRRELSGAPAGVGSVYSWWGDANVGEGRMTIVDSHAPRDVTVRLEFMRPMAATNTAEFTFVPHGDGTDVTWTMHGRNGFAGKAVALFLDMDEMIGTQFEQGLANLDAVTASRD
jgi:carbon monoxide dehydrogenase subunit G